MIEYRETRERVRERYILSFFVVFVLLSYRSIVHSRSFLLVIDAGCVRDKVVLQALADY